MALVDPAGAQPDRPDAAEASPNLSEHGYQDLTFMEFLEEAASNQKHAPSQDTASIADIFHKQPAMPGSIAAAAPSQSSLQHGCDLVTSRNRKAAHHLQVCEYPVRQQLPGASAASRNQQQQAQPAQQPQGQPVDAVQNKADQQDLSSLMLAWDQSVSSHLSKQTAICSGHRHSASPASEAEKAQAFSRLILLQDMQRVAAATKAMAQNPPAVLRKRPFGMPGDDAALDHADVFRALIELDRAFQHLPGNNHPSAVASEALALWRSLTRRASTMPSFRSPTTLQDGKAAPVKTASRVPAASGTKEEATLRSTANASGGKARREAGASSSGRIRGEHAQLQQSAAQKAGRGTGSHDSHITSMIPEELLPMIYVTWEMETVQMMVPSWS